MKLDEIDPAKVKTIATLMPKGEPGECWPCCSYKTTEGYGRVEVTLVSGVVKNMRLHRIAYLIEHGEIPGELHVLHRCDNPPFCNPSHLFLGTNAENMADKVAKGRLRRSCGERNGHAVLTQAQVIAIRADPRVHRVIANDYGVMDQHISRIKNRKAWRHI